MQADVPDKDSALIELRDSIAERCNLATDALPMHVVQRAATDPLFLHHLLTVGGDTMLLGILLGARGEIRPVEKADSTETELLWGAAKATIRWLTAGARFADQKTIAARLEACVSCEHRKPASHSRLYVMLKTKHVCGLCGCDIDMKVRLAHETCPDTTSSDHGRW
ncbi:MAG: hypothetical protein CTR54_05805 [Rhizobium sp.]|nr:MAG: hypothetical protein CTR54_05805 [Rhizobium sp.]